MEGGAPCQGMLVEGVRHLEEGVEEEDHHQEGVGEEVDHHQGMVVGEVVGDLPQGMEVGEVVAGLHPEVVVGVEVGVLLHHLVGVGEGADHLKNKQNIELEFLVLIQMTSVAMSQNVL